MPQFEASLTDNSRVVIYEHNMFIKQATGLDEFRVIIKVRFIAYLIVALGDVLGPYFEMSLMQFIQTAFSISYREKHNCVHRPLFVNFNQYFILYRRYK
jgi:hypothetical protein